MSEPLLVKWTHTLTGLEPERVQAARSEIRSWAPSNPARRLLAETVDAAVAALEVTGESEWRQMAHDAFAWFFGNNDAGIPMADTADGSCYDGLMATGINRNQGAESILSLHLAAQTVREIFSDRKQSGQDRLSEAEARTFAAS